MEDVVYLPMRREGKLEDDFQDNISDGHRTISSRHQFACGVSHGEVGSF